MCEVDNSFIYGRCCVSHVKTKSLRATDSFFWCCCIVALGFGLKRAPLREALGSYQMLFCYQNKYFTTIHNTKYATNMPLCFHKPDSSLATTAKPPEYTTGDLSEMWLAAEKEWILIMETHYDGNAICCLYSLYSCHSLFFSIENWKIGMRIAQEYTNIWVRVFLLSLMGPSHFSLA